MDDKVTDNSPCHGASPTYTIDGLPRCSYEFERSGEMCGALLVLCEEPLLRISENELTHAHIAEVNPTLEERLQARAEYVKGNRRLEEGWIVAVSETGDGHRLIEFSDKPGDDHPRSGFGGVPSVEDSFPMHPMIEEGDKIRVLGGLGRPVHGLDVWGDTDADNVDGPHWIPVFFKPDSQVKQEWAFECARIRVERALEWVGEARAKADADYETLPEVLRKRFDILREEDPDRQSWEPYEMFCATEAVKLADHLRPVYEEHYASLSNLAEALHALDDGEKGGTVGDWFSEVTAVDDRRRRLYAAQVAVVAFDRLPFEEQKGVLSDQHSGNTHGAALRLAMFLLAGDDEALVPEAKRVAA